MAEENGQKPAIPPNQTLYIRNINEKVKPDELRKDLFLLFSTHGELLEINIKKSHKMRGQAFVVFKELSQAADAMHALQRFPFMGRELDIHFARTSSDILGKRRAEPKAPPREKAKKAERQEPVQPVVTNVLKVVDLPKEVTAGMLEELFKQYPGYNRGTLLAEKALAFIEYLNEEQATMALRGLKGFQLMPGRTLQVDYAPVECT
eukprot:TRINITY_DN1896_c0_g1_i17.p1 TRINITY_DN1896_c0_g1~~TRINITY_DN1896_c0_g1_i17.p1  ORF type:complete len:206 (-),score=66.35 TRINITY_DN1896_c0_g1_i17:133-750(-)